jgi:hypothetical protein
MMIGLRGYPRLVWLGPAALALAGVLPLSPHYYPLLRVVLVYTYGFLSFDTAKAEAVPRSVSWALAFAVAAIVVNPFFPLLHFQSKDEWVAFDLVSAALLALHMTHTRGWSP